MEKHEKKSLCNAALVWSHCIYAFGIGSNNRDTTGLRNNRTWERKHGSVVWVHKTAPEGLREEGDSSYG